MRHAAALFFALFFGVPPIASATAQTPIVEKVSFDTNPAGDVKPARLTATLYLPRRSVPVAAMVIIVSSGGVLDWIEGYYARELARQGIAGLVVDSFGPRGVKNLIEDQSRVIAWDMENDAFAALAFLQKDKRIDAAHVGIMGLSKGGLVAQQSAFVIRRIWRRTGEATFAAHVAIAPDCAAHHRTAWTTGKPIFFMLAELDDFVSPERCADYAEKIKAAGNPNVVVKVYKGARHNWEDTGSVKFLAKAENFSKCFEVIDDDGGRVKVDGRGPTLRTTAENFVWNRANCRTLGAHVGGGNEKLKREATADLIAFLRKNGF